ncbi:MAG: hypothetical protein HY787_11065 [Deltaproteobacteria bacterium]|nr:hypothetical protein [Deltaproteobacteria bacterium]
MRLFSYLEKAEFLARPNRFLVRCLKDEEEIMAFLPNSGRLQDLLFPGRRIYLARDKTIPIFLE